MKKVIASVFLLIVFSFSIVLFHGVRYEIITISRASTTNILVEGSKIQGPLPHPWQYLAQGGEEAESMLDDIASELKALKPTYIRIDYIFNFYDVVRGKNNGRMTFYWEKLDQRIQDILNTGAKPLLSLSYMPQVLTLNAVRDPSFEEGISGYIYNPPGAKVTMTRVSPGYEGSFSLKLDNSAGTAKGYYFVEAGNKDGNLNDNIDVRYDWSVFVRADTPSQESVGLTWHYGPETYFVTSTNWQKILVNGKIGPEQYFSRWYVIVPPGKTIYIDNLELTANPYNGIYDPTPPSYWSDWQTVVRETIEHYSGKDQKNLTDVYYEVWNEPQVFGGWSIDGSTLNDYRLIYKYAAQGAQEAQNVNSFKFGGPSSVVADQGWMTTFFKFVQENNLRCDFISWHTYTDDPSAMARDVDNIDSWKAPFPNVTNAEKLITEWGPFAGMPSKNDNEFSAAYSVVALRNLLEKNVKPFVFEIKDGPSNVECWGRWGMITHEKFGKHKKAEYNAFKTLSLLKSNRISLTGENSFVKGIASRDDDGSLALVLANYDKNKSHAEEISLNISDLPNGNYTYQEYLIDATHSNYCNPPSHEDLEEIANEQIWINQGSLTKTINMGPNSVTLVTLVKALTFPLPYQIISWEATDPTLYHQTGRAEGTDWSANTATDGPGFLNYGPYYDGFEGGKYYRVTWKLLIDVHNPGYNDNVLYIDIYDATAGKLLGFKNVYRNEFISSNTYQDFSFDFNYTAGHKMEFRTWWHDRAYIKLDKIVVTSDTPPSLPTPTPTPPPSFPLSPGWNQITWPDIQNYTAKTALGDIDSDCGAGTAVAIAKKEKDWWEKYVQNYGGENFSLQSNQSYHIKVSKNCTWNP